MPSAVDGATLDAAVDGSCCEVNTSVGVSTPDLRFVHWSPSTGADRPPWLAQYKRLCDELLPALRERSHLHNLIYRHRHNGTLGLCSGNVLLGGCTYRAFSIARDAGGPVSAGTAVLEVLLIAVAQRPGVCGHGHGTRIVNALKRAGTLLAKMLADPTPVAASAGMSPARHERRQPAVAPPPVLLLTQSDIGPIALAFWRRQRLEPGRVATEALELLRGSDRSVVVYDHTLPVSLTLGQDATPVSPAPSARAQERQDDDDGADEAANARAPAGSAARPQAHAVRCGACGGHAGELLRCSLCSCWFHPRGRCGDESEAEPDGGAAAAGGMGTELNGPTDPAPFPPADPFECAECIEMRASLGRVLRRDRVEGVARLIGSCLAGDAGGGAAAHGGEDGEDASARASGAAAAHGCGCSFSPPAAAGDASSHETAAPTVPVPSGAATASKPSGMLSAAGPADCSRLPAAGHGGLSVVHLPRGGSGLATVSPAAVQTGESSPRAPPQSSAGGDLGKATGGVPSARPSAVIDPPAGAARAPPARAPPPSCQAADLPAGGHAAPATDGMHAPPSAAAMPSVPSTTRAQASADAGTAAAPPPAESSPLFAAWPSRRNPAHSATLAAWPSCRVGSETPARHAQPLSCRAEPVSRQAEPLSRQAHPPARQAEPPSRQAQPPASHAGRPAARPPASSASGPAAPAMREPQRTPAERRALGRWGLLLDSLSEEHGIRWRHAFRRPSSSSSGQAARRPGACSASVFGAPLPPAPLPPVSSRGPAPRLSEADLGSVAWAEWHKASQLPDRIRAAPPPADRRRRVQGRVPSARAAAVPAASSAVAPPASAGARAHDSLARLLDGRFLGASGGAPPPPVAPSPAPPMSQVAAVAAAVLREEEALRLVRRGHHAASLDSVSPDAKARLRFLPTLSTHASDPTMHVPLVRNGLLGLLRRWLQGAADLSLTREDDRRTLQNASVAICLAVAGAVMPAHLQQSRGLGRLLMLLSATATAQDGPLRHRAAEAVAAMMKPGVAGPGTQLPAASRSVADAPPTAAACGLDHGRRPPDTGQLVLVHRPKQLQRRTVPSFPPMPPAPLREMSKPRREPPLAHRKRACSPCAEPRAGAPARRRQPPAGEDGRDV